MALELYLGANTPNGFCSYFEKFADRMRRVYIIKGGPGSGKSTMMKKLAAFGENSGAETVRIYCSSDNDSLDGVWFPKHGLLYADGTAPHVLEAKTPGACETLIDFGQCFDTVGLEAELSEIRKADALLKAQYARCYAYLSAAKQCKRCADESLSPDDALILRRADALLRRTIPRRKGMPEGRRFDVFLGSFTKDGKELRPLPEDYALVPIHDPASAAGALLEKLAQETLRSGYDILAAHDPYDPTGDAMHVLIPELRLGFVSSGRAFGYDDAPGRRLRIENARPGADSIEKTRLRRDRKLQTALEVCAAQALTDAKQTHDRIEALYKPYVCFSEADRITEQQLEALSRKLFQK